MRLSPSPERLTFWNSAGVRCTAGGLTEAEIARIAAELECVRGRLLAHPDRRSIEGAQFVGRILEQLREARIGASAWRDAA